MIDTGNYAPPREGSIAEIDAGLPETAWTQRQLGVPVVKAFNNITDHSLEHRGRPPAVPGRIALPVCGDDAAGRAPAMAVAEALGFTAVDAGPLAGSWRQQIGQPAYCVDPTPAELARLLARADKAWGARNRAQSMRLMAKLPPDLPEADLTHAARFMAGWDEAAWPAGWRWRWRWRWRCWADAGAAQGAILAAPSLMLPAAGFPAPGLKGNRRRSVEQRSVHWRKRPPAFNICIGKPAVRHYTPAPCSLTSGPPWSS